MKGRILSFFLALLIVIPCLPLAAIPVFAEKAPTETDAMKNINSDTELNSCRQGDVQTVESDGYIGIPVEVTVYYDITKGASKPGYGGTPVILYAVNTNTERIGTSADTDIIKSMLGRGYAVAVADYRNHPKSVSPELEYSAQKLRTKLKNGDFFADKSIFPSGTYQESHVVPAGYNISLDLVYYEIDKHGEDGALEKTVEIWNYDFRSCYANTVIKWTDSSGVRKSVQNGFDGSSPEWYSDPGGKTVDNENGQYIKIKHTWAKKIEDCVKKDGTPIDLNLYAHVIYPTNPESEVPVMMLACSSEHLAGGYAQEDRPYLVGYMFAGYAVATYDFEYVPMARNDHYGYFAGDASGGVTGQNGTFALGTYNRGLYNTAAVRFIRHLSVNEHSTYRFDNDRIGVFGNSKGGFQTFLGSEGLQGSVALSELGAGKTAEELEVYLDKKVSDFFRERYFVVMDPNEQITDPNGQGSNNTAYNGNTRFQNGKTEDIIFGEYKIDGGTVQPWLTYTDSDGMLREIPSGVQLVYSSCGGTTDAIGKNHAPVFTATNYYDSFGSGYTTHNYLANLLRIYDIPSLFFEVPLEHSFVSGFDVTHGVDTYKALFKFSAYYLKNEPVSVVYTTPVSGGAGISVTAGISIKFYGAVPAEEIDKAVIADENGNTAAGKWSAGFGCTEWTFYPEVLNGGVKYTVTLPASLKGDNGKEMGTEYSFSFYTKPELTEHFSLSAPVTVTEENGSWFSFTVPENISGYNQLKLRFKVDNNAANTAQIYEAESLTDAAGAMIGEINLSGAGCYEYDVTDYVMSRTAGSEVYFRVKAGKAASDDVTYNHDFKNTADITCNVSSSIVNEVEENDGVSALKLTILSSPGGKYGYRAYNGWYPTLFQNSKLINGGKAVTKADYGRSFTVKLRIYDTASRSVQLWFNDCTNGRINTGDYDYSRAVFKTVAGEWTDISVDYTVYESDYGIAEQIKNFKFIGLSTGSSELPIYIDSLTVTEHVTDISLSAASLVLASEGNNAYKAPSSENGEAAFEVNGNEYANWWDAVNATVNLENTAFAASPEKATVKLLKNYEFTVRDGGQIINSRSNFVLDLNGYKLTLNGTSVLNLGAINNNTANFTVKNGTVILGDKPLVSHLSASSGGSGKIYNISFENLYIGISGTGSRVMLTDVISASTAPAGAKIAQNISFDGCTLNIEKERLPKTPVTVFSLGENSLKTSYSITGGEIRLSSLAAVSVCSDLRAIVFNADVDGGYTDFVMPEAVKLPEDMSVMSDKGYAAFVKGDVSDGYCTYNLTSARYSTKYGVIPDDKAPEEWPFAVFTGGELVGLYNAFSIGNDNKENAMWCAWNQLRGVYADKEVQIVLRRDYDMTESGSRDTYYPNLSQIGGTLIIDLGDNTLTLKQGVSLFNAEGKYGYDNVQKINHVYDSNIIVRGGNVVANETLIKISSMHTKTEAAIANYNKRKDFYITFEGTEITVPATSRANLIIAHDTGSNRSNLTYGAKFDITFNSCGFDVSAAGSNKSFFNGTYENQMNDLNVAVNGGNINAGTLEGYNLCLLDSEDSFVFGKDAKGFYTTLTAPKDYPLPSFGGMTDTGSAMAFENGEVNGEYKVYSLAKNDYVTEYGVIPEQYDAQTYPFAVFKDGKFIAACKLYSQRDNAGTVFKTVLDLIRGEYKGEVVQVLLRRDYDMTAPGNADQQFDNLGQIGGTFILDLGGHTFTTKSSLRLLPYTAKYGYDNVLKKNHVYDSAVIVRNGTVYANSALLDISSMSYSDPEKALQYDKTKIADITFENLKISVSDSVKSGGALINSRNAVNSDHGAQFNVVFNGCEIDISANRAAIPLFRESTSECNKLKVTLNGGKIKAGSFEGGSLCDFHDSEDTLRFGKGENGYTEISLISGSAPADAVVTVNGESMYFGKYSSSADGAVTTSYYRLGYRTEYGVIPAEYDAENYPFAVFMDGELVGAYSIWCQDNSESALWAARLQTVGKLGEGRTVYVLLRRDYTVSAADNNYNNLAHLSGTVIFDFGSYTFTLTGGKPLFNAKAQTVGDSSGTYVCDSNFTVRGGIIITDGSPVIVAFTNVADKNLQFYDRAKSFNITFEKTNFIIPGGNGKRIFNATDLSNSGLGGNWYITLNDCVIDMTDNSTVSTLFSGTDEKNVNNMILKINGGQILAADFDGVAIAGIGEGDSLTFGSIEGEYISIILPAGAAAPGGIYTTAEGNAVFKEKSTDGENTVYTLAVCTHSYSGECDRICNECGYERETETEHVYDGDCDSECNICGEKREAEHSYTLLEYSEAEHWYRCECGAIDGYTREAHFGGESVCNEKAICTGCGQEYGDITSHNPSSEWTTDGRYHWKECTNGCGQVFEKGEHTGGTATCMEKAVCSVCKEKYGYIYTNAHTAASEWTADGNNHWRECENGCGKPLEKAGHSGGSAACGEKAVCTVCGEEYGERGGHSYSDEWITDAEKHWHQCKCGDKKDISVHEFGEWTEKDGEREKSCICGYTVTESIPEEPTNPDEPTEPAEPTVPTEPTTPEEPSTPEEPNTPSEPVPDKSGIHPAAVAAAVIGGIAAVSGITAALYFFVFKKKK